MAKEQINIRLSSEKKQRWEEFAQEEGYGTLSQLIRLSVEKTINDSWVWESSIGTEVDTQSLEDELSEVKEQIQSLGSQLDDLYQPDEVSNHEEELDLKEIQNLANRVHDLIPQVRSEDDMRAMLESAGTSASTLERKAQLTGATEPMAKALDEPVYHVRQALIWLENEQFNSIQSSIIEGLRRWYEIDESIEFEEELDESELRETLSEHSENGTIFKSGSEFQ